MHFTDDFCWRSLEPWLDPWFPACFYIFKCIGFKALTKVQFFKFMIYQWCSSLDKLLLRFNFISIIALLSKCYYCWWVLDIPLCPTLCNPMYCIHQAPLSMGCSRQEYWGGLPFPSPGDRPNTGIEPRSPIFQVDSLPSETSRKPLIIDTS